MNTTKVLLIIGLVYISFQQKQESTRNMMLIITILLFLCMSRDVEGYCNIPRELILEPSQIKRRIETDSNNHYLYLSWLDAIRVGAANGGVNLYRSSDDSVVSPFPLDDWQKAVGPPGDADPSEYYYKSDEIMLWGATLPGVDGGNTEEKGRNFYDYNLEFLMARYDPMGFSGVGVIDQTALGDHPDPNGCPAVPQGSSFTTRHFPTPHRDPGLAMFRDFGVWGGEEVVAGGDEDIAQRCKYENSEDATDPFYMPMSTVNRCAGNWDGWRGDPESDEFAATRAGRQHDAYRGVTQVQEALGNPQASRDAQVRATVGPRPRIGAAADMLNNSSFITFITGIQTPINNLQAIPEDLDNADQIIAGIRTLESQGLDYLQFILPDEWGIIDTLRGRAQLLIDQGAQDESGSGDSTPSYTCEQGGANNFTCVTDGTDGTTILTFNLPDGITLGGDGINGNYTISGGNPSSTPDSVTCEPINDGNITCSSGDADILTFSGLTPESTLEGGPGNYNVSVDTSGGTSGGGSDLCGPGTTLDGSQCAPNIQECGPGTILNGTNNKCEPTSSVCQGSSIRFDDTDKNCRLDTCENVNCESMITEMGELVTDEDRTKTQRRPNPEQIIIECQEHRTESGELQGRPRSQCVFSNCCVDENEELAEIEENSANNICGCGVGHGHCEPWGVLGGLDWDQLPAGGSWVNKSGYTVTADNASENSDQIKRCGDYIIGDGYCWSDKKLSGTNEPDPYPCGGG